MLLITCHEATERDLDYLAAFGGKGRMSDKIKEEYADNDG